MSAGHVVVGDSVRRFADFAELAHLVAEAGGMLTIRSGILRDLVDAGRLGVHIREAIAAELERVGLGRLPEPVPDDQTHAVVVYLRSSPAGRAVQLGVDLATASRVGPTC